MQTRRTFLKRAAGAGAGLALAPAVRRAGAAKSADLNVAIVGVGRHGRDLLTTCLKIPGIRFKAVCDIWPYASGYAARILKAYGHIVNVYQDYRDLLASEPDLDAAIIATPDWVHADQAVACLEGGLHVYCEKEMATTLEGGRRMVRAARAAGRRLQVGRQHRSNPRYHAALDLIHRKRALGRITHVSGQWRGHKRDPLDWPKKYEMDKATLEK